MEAKEMGIISGVVKRNWTAKRIRKRHQDRPTKRLRVVGWTCSVIYEQKYDIQYTRQAIRIFGARFFVKE
jgi:hypothetical protein